MKILLVNQFFWPDSAATSQLLTDLAEELAGRGHQVEVLCAASAYAGGPAAAGSGAAATVGATPPPVTIHRVPALRFGRGKLVRVLSYLSFYLGAAWSALTLPRAELVLTLTTPPLLPLLGTLLKRVRGTRHFIWEMDVYPDVAVALGYLRRGTLLERTIGALADYARRHADGILALGECMRDRLIGRGIAPAKIVIAENWADGDAIQPFARPADATRDKLVLLYSGNLGLAHDVDTIAAAMLALRERNGFRFLFTGGGQRRAELEAFCLQEKIVAAEFRPYVDRLALGEALGAGDIGLVTQQDACLGAVVPSKVYGLLAAGRPVLFIGPQEATPARIIREHGCGWHIPCGDAGSLTQLLLELAADPCAVEQAGRRARQVLLTHYDRPLGVAHICDALGAFALTPQAVLQPYALRELERTRS